LVSGDYVTSRINLSGGDAILVQGKVRLYVTGNFDVTGNSKVEILPGGSLEIYIGGTGNISGNGIVNDTQLASRCAVYGLNSCKILTYSGTSSFIGKVYAPHAAFTLTGTSDAYGSFVANSFNCQGTMGLHYDEALGQALNFFQPISWEEF
jgi:hypothetical protein